MSRFEIASTPLAGLALVTRKLLGDDRGFLARLFCAEELASAGWRGPIAQINHTLTRKRGAVRGMHFQFPPHAEIKLVTCVRGEVFDVAVDIRRDSPTRLNWHGERLSADNRRALLIPKGFAHGFQALSEEAELIYCHSAPYAAAAEGGLNPGDPALAIAWPLEITEISVRDRSHAVIAGNFEGVSI